MHCLSFCLIACPFVYQRPQFCDLPGRETPPERSNRRQGPKVGGHRTTARRGAVSHEFLHRERLRPRPDHDKTRRGRTPARHPSRSLHNSQSDRYRQQRPQRRRRRYPLHHSAGSEGLVVFAEKSRGSATGQGSLICLVPSPIDSASRQAAKPPSRKGDFLASLRLGVRHPPLPSKGSPMHEKPPAKSLTSRFKSIPRSALGCSNPCTRRSWSTS